MLVKHIAKSSLCIALMFGGINIEQNSNYIENDSDFMEPAESLKSLWGWASLNSANAQESTESVTVFGSPPTTFIDLGSISIGGSAQNDDRDSSSNGNDTGNHSDRIAADREQHCGEIALRKSICVSDAKINFANNIKLCPNANSVTIDIEFGADGKVLKVIGINGSISGTMTSEPFNNCVVQNTAVQEAELSMCSTMELIAINDWPAYKCEVSK